MRHPTLTPQLRSQVARYAQSHRHPINKALHFLGIPALAIAALGLLARVALSLPGVPLALQPNAAWLVLLGTGLWYILLDPRLGMFAALALAACYAAGSALPPWLLGGLFAFGVVAHAVGHFAFEHKPPALFKHPVAVFEAPAWLLSTWTGAYQDKCP